ncbi:tetratricopeptide repeat protein [Leptospira sp. WS92.C1]
MILVRHFILILLFFSSFVSISSTSEENRKEWNRAVKEKILKMNTKQEETESIPYLEKFVEKNPSDLTVKLWYARALFYRQDLELPGHSEDIFSRMEKLKKIRENYLHASRIFEEVLEYLAMATPRDPNLGKWHFLWAMCEWYGGREDRAVQIFKKSFKYDFRLNEANYNIAAIYQTMGQLKDADIYFRTYLKNDKEMREEN